MHWIKWKRSAIGDCHDLYYIVIFIPLHLPLNPRIISCCCSFCVGCWPEAIIMTCESQIRKQHFVIAECVRWTLGWQIQAFTRHCGATSTSVLPPHHHQASQWPLDASGFHIRPSLACPSFHFRWCRRDDLVRHANLALAFSLMPDPIELLYIRILEQSIGLYVLFMSIGSWRALLFLFVCKVWMIKGRLYTCQHLGWCRESPSETP